MLLLLKIASIVTRIDFYWILMLTSPDNNAFVNYQPNYLPVLHFIIAAPPVKNLHLLRENEHYYTSRKNLNILSYFDLTNYIHGVS
jgi:hypothetical protein